MKKKKKIIIWIIILAVLGFGVYELSTNKKAESIYTTEDVTRGNLTETVSVTGEVDSSDESDLSFLAEGRINGIMADVGDKVVKGQKLATIDSSTFPQQLRQSELDIKIQKETLQNMQNNRGTYSKDQRDAQKAAIKKAQEGYSAVLRQMRDNAIYAPVSGMVVRRDVDLGETVMAGKTILSIADPDSLVLNVDIPEVDVVNVTPGQKALVTFDALTDDDIFVGEIEKVEPAATVIQDVVYYKVKIRLDNFDKRLKMGMTCNADIITAEAPGVLMVPSRAIKKEEGKKYVEILHGTDGKEEVEKVYVEVGISGDNGMTEIKNNLKEGEKVITFKKEKV